MAQKFSITYFSTLLYLVVVKCSIKVSYSFSLSGRDFIRSETWVNRRICTGGSTTSRTTSRRQMVLTPIGPFCPFRSSAAMDMETGMEKFHSSTSMDFAMEMTRLQLEMQMDIAPDPDRLRKVGEGILDAVQDWEQLLNRLEQSTDFQTREYAKMTQAHLARHNQTTTQIASMMKWQGECMIAMSRNSPPPMPPSDINLAELMEQTKIDKSNTGNKAPSMSAMAAAEQITSTPFTGEEPAFQSDNVKLEYEQLCKDHAGLISIGSGYANFDSTGKIMYLEQLEQIEDRWDIFFTRFSLLGQLNQSFVEQCNAFLESMQLDETNFRQLVSIVSLYRDSIFKQCSSQPTTLQTMSLIILSHFYI